MNPQHSALPSDAAPHRCPPESQSCSWPTLPPILKKLPPSPNRSRLESFCSAPAPPIHDTDKDPPPDTPSKYPRKSPPSPPPRRLWRPSSQSPPLPSAFFR